jgi:hypothetical protein
MGCQLCEERKELNESVVSSPLCFLLFKGAPYITGQVISVNGGYPIAM